MNNLNSAGIWTNNSREVPFHLQITTCKNVNLCVASIISVRTVAIPVSITIRRQLCWHFAGEYLRGIEAGGALEEQRAEEKPRASGLTISWGHRRIDKVQLIICTPLGMVLYSYRPLKFLFQWKWRFYCGISHRSLLVLLLCCHLHRFWMDLHLSCQKGIYRTLLSSGWRWQRFDGVIRCISSASFSFLFWWIAVDTFCKCPKKKWNYQMFTNQTSNELKSLHDQQLESSFGEWN